MYKIKNNIFYIHIIITDDHEEIIRIRLQRRITMTLEEAKSLMTPEALSKLREATSSRPSINMDNKANNDILMNALCNAVSSGMILPESLDDKTIKLLNAKTNTLSPTKLGHILTIVKETQPDIICEITLMKPIDTIIKVWRFDNEDVSFTEMFAFILEYFKLTPNIVRSQMSQMLKPTIVNNIAQLVAKYAYGDEQDRAEINVSITTLTRLVNMCDHVLLAEFKKK